MNDSDNYHNGTDYDDDEVDPQEFSGQRENTSDTTTGQTDQERVNDNAPQVTAPSVKQYTPPVNSEICAIIGPSGSGKTTLLAAIERSCEMPAEDGINLEFFPEPAIAHIIGRTVNKVLNKEGVYEATFGVADYGFRISVTEKENSFFSLPLEVDFRGELSDSGGGIIFPVVPMEEEIKERSDIRAYSEQEISDVLDRLQNASTIVLCVDASKRNIRLLYERIGIVLSQSRDQNSVYRRPLKLKEKLHYWIRRRPIPPYIERARPALKAKRFLLLLTHIDQLCEPAPNPELMARMINPVVQARETLGPPLLEKIRKSLPHNAQFAVGVCSPWGFNGEEKGWTPFADRNGEVVSASPDEQGEELLLKWKPFGVRDAIYFIATGRCRGSVKLVTEQVLANYKTPSKMIAYG